MPDLIQLTNFGRPPKGSPWMITRKEIVPAPPERVWQALTSPAELTRWWCDRAEVDLRPPGRYAFEGPHVYGGSASPESAAAAESQGILEVEAPVKLAFRWKLHGVETLVSYELRNHLEYTELRVIQSAEESPGWLGGPDDPNWWWIALPALRSYVEKGQPDLRLNYAAERAASTMTFQASITTFPWIIWHKLTSPTELDRWWAREATLEPRCGGRFELGLERFGPRTILAIEEERRLVHDWRWLDGTMATVEWKIEEREDDVLLSVTDVGPRDATLPRDFCSIYWVSTLLALKQISERGTVPREYQDGF